jgi:hypothetical protein
MFDIVLPEQFRQFTTEHLRVIVFIYLSMQVVFAIAFISFCKRFNSLPVLANSKFTDPFFRGLRIRPTSLADFFALIALFIILLSYSFLIINNANLSFPDQSHITAGAMLGELWMQINPGNGRFSPLLHQEFLLF